LWRHPPGRRPRRRSFVRPAEPPDDGRRPRWTPGAVAAGG
jgi:hypothetical protein